MVICLNRPVSSGIAPRIDSSIMLKSDSELISYASSIHAQHRYPCSAAMDVTFRGHPNHETGFSDRWAGMSIQGTFLHIPIRLHVQAVDCPLQICKTGIVKGAIHFADNQQIGIRVFHHVHDVPKGRCFGLFGSTGTLTHSVTAFEVPKRAITTAHNIRQIKFVDLGFSPQDHHHRKSQQAPHRPDQRHL